MVRSSSQREFCNTFEGKTDIIARQRYVYFSELPYRNRCTSTKSSPLEPAGRLATLGPTAHDDGGAADAVQLGGDFGHLVLHMGDQLAHTRTSATDQLS